ncbi:MAG: ornithine carbamoyltransferase, partial [Clostridiales bacterium]
ENVSKPLHQCKLIFCGDIRNNVACALMYGCAKMGMHYVGYGPRELKIADTVMTNTLAVARETGATIEITDNPACLKNADALYTDIWASMGEEEQTPERVRILTPFKVTKELMAKTENPDCIFLHCLPSFHDFDTANATKWQEKGLDIREVTDDVFLSANSKVFDEAENRMHTIKAVIIATIV